MTTVDMTSPTNGDTSKVIVVWNKGNNHDVSSHPQSVVSTMSESRNVSIASLSQSTDSKGQRRLRQGYLPETSNAFLYRFEYLRMIFDPKLWQKEAVAILGSTIASLYATLLVCVYIAFSFTELVTYPKYKEYLEINGFFIYLFLMSDIYFMFVIYQVLVANHVSNDKTIVVENEKSHGSLTLRIGSLIFGVGTFIYLLLQLVDFFQNGRESPCYHVAKGINVFLMLFFVFLQAFVIFTYPRLNLLWHQLINKYGTMHIVATNIILWIRTLIKESLEEIAEIEHEHESARSINESEMQTLGHAHNECNQFLESIKKSEHAEEACLEFKNDILGKAIERTTPYLYPFIIEFALIGASVTFIMSSHIGKRPAHPEVVPNRVRKPNIKKFLEKKDFSHSLKGIIAGLVILTIALVNLTLFFGLDVHEHTEDAAEKLSKISNTIINLLGIVGLVIGIAEIQQLNFKYPDKHHMSSEMDLDMKLLRFTSLFAYIYMIFTIITGVFHTNIIEFPNELHVVNGCVSIIQITMQIAFIDNLKHKVIPPDKEFTKPGRQITVFLFLFNIAQWLVFTFEIQKVRASLVEADFYGFMPWIVIRRVTLPLAVFFRFHSAVVFIELFGEVFDDELETKKEEFRMENHHL